MPLIAMENQWDEGLKSISKNNGFIQLAQSVRLGVALPMLVNLLTVHYSTVLITRS